MIRRALSLLLRRRTARRARRAQTEFYAGRWYSPATTRRSEP